MSAPLSGIHHIHDTGTHPHVGWLQERHQVSAAVERMQSSPPSSSVAGQTAISVEMANSQPVHVPTPAHAAAPAPVAASMPTPALAVTTGGVSTDTSQLLGSLQSQQPASPPVSGDDAVETFLGESSTLTKALTALLVAWPLVFIPFMIVGSIEVVQRAAAGADSRIVLSNFYIDRAFAPQSVLHWCVSFPCALFLAVDGIDGRLTLSDFLFMLQDCRL